MIWQPKHGCFFLPRKFRASCARSNRTCSLRLHSAPARQRAQPTWVVVGRVNKICCVQSCRHFGMVLQNSSFNGFQIRWKNSLEGKLRAILSLNWLVRGQFGGKYDKLTPHGELRDTKLALRGPPNGNLGGPKPPKMGGVEFDPAPTGRADPLGRGRGAVNSPGLGD